MDDKFFNDLFDNYEDLYLTSFLNSDDKEKKEKLVVETVSSQLVIDEVTVTNDDNSDNSDKDEQYNESISGVNLVIEASQVTDLSLDNVSTSESMLSYLSKFLLYIRNLPFKFLLFA